MGCIGDLDEKGAFDLSLYKKEKFYLVFLLVFFTFFFLATKTVNEQARLYPYIVCSLGILLTIVQLGITVAKEKAGKELDAEAPMTKRQLYHLAVALGSSVVYVLLASWLGFFTTTFVYVVLFCYWHTPTQKKWMYPAVALGMDAVIYVGFKILLSIPLPSGLLI
ncbi:tripartite tricarboxylate transporter TctB family protein [bacterium 1xD42-67]|nr:tripartite tricarboxylate transporter TctB family protein [bacterium 1xD42-67]